MKTKAMIILAAMSVAALALSGCQREGSAPESGQKERISLRFENVKTPETRLDVDGVTGAGTWSAGDRIAVYVTGRGANFYQVSTLEDIVGNEGHAEVYLAGGQTRANFAVYPAEVAVQGHGGSADDLLIRYPDSYDFLNLSLAGMATCTPSPMVAVNVGHEDLHFYHVGGVLRLTVPNVPMAVTKLRIYFPDDIQYTGTFKVNIPEGGLTEATLSPVDGGESDDHGHIITINLPVIETATASLTFNIPIPNGSVSPEVRNYRVEVFSGDTPIAKTGEVMNWWEFQRAEGRQVSLPPLQGFGTMAGRYIIRNSCLARTDAESQDRADLYLDSVDDLAPLSKYGMGDWKTHYFNCHDLAAFFGVAATTGFVGLDLMVDGTPYKIPSSTDFDYIINGPRYGATVNGTPGVRYAKIKVNASPLSGVRINANSIFYNADVCGVLLFPDFGSYDIEGLTVFNTASAAFTPTLSYVEMRRLCSGETDCVFLPCGGTNSGRGFSEGNTDGYYRLSNYSYNNAATTLRFNASNVNVVGSLAAQYYGVVRLLRK